MNRRSFFKSLGVATAALYLRLAPSAVKDVQSVRLADELLADAREVACHIMKQCEGLPMATQALIFAALVDKSVRA